MNASDAWSNRAKAIILGLGLGLAFHTSGNWWKIFTDRVPECGQPNCVADFAAIYTGARLMWENPGSLYDPGAQLAYQNNIAPTERALPFVYPPITAAVFSPLGAMSFSRAFLLITCLNILLVCTSVRMWSRSLELTKDQSQWLALFTFCNFGVHAVMFYGQTSAIVLFVLSCHILVQTRTTSARAGWWAGWLCLKPQLMAIPWILLSVNRKWRDLIIATVTALLLLAGGFAWVGIEATKQYLQLAQNISFEHNWSNPISAMHNWKALTATWFPTTWQAYAQWLGVLLGIAALVDLNRRAQGRPKGFVISGIANVLALLLVSPHLYTHDLTLLVIPCALFLSLSKGKVPIRVGLGLMAIASLPALNYLLPTSTAITLLLLFMLTVGFGARNFGRSRHHHSTADL